MSILRIFCGEYTTFLRIKIKRGASQSLAPLSFIGVAGRMPAFLLLHFLVVGVFNGVVVGTLVVADL